MRKTAVVLAILAFLIVIIVGQSINRMDGSTLDIHFNDTYLIVGGLHFYVLILLVLLLAGFTFACLVSKFRNKTYNILLILASSGILGCCGYLYGMTM